MGIAVDGMPTAPHPPMKPNALRTVLVTAIDRTPSIDQVLHTTLSMARVIPGAEVHIVHAVDVGQPPHVLAIPMTDQIRDGRAFLDQISSKVAAEFAGKCTAHLTVGPPVARILQLASDLSADLIVVGTQD